MDFLIGGYFHRSCGLILYDHVHPTSLKDYGGMKSCSFESTTIIDQGIHPLASRFCL